MFFKIVSFGHCNVYLKHGLLWNYSCTNETSAELVSRTKDLQIRDAICFFSKPSECSATIRQLARAKNLLKLSLKIVFVGFARNWKILCKLQTLPVSRFMRHISRFVVTVLKSQICFAFALTYMFGSQYWSSKTRLQSKDASRDTFCEFIFASFGFTDIPLNGPSTFTSLTLVRSLVKKNTTYSAKMNEIWKFGGVHDWYIYAIVRQK